MRYLREWQNPQGKQAQAFEDEVTDIDVTPRLVTLTSSQGPLTVRAQFTRAELAQVLEVLRHEEQWARRLALEARPREQTFVAWCLRLFSFRF